MAAYGAGSTGIWYYKDDDKMWQPYHPCSNKLLEEAYTNGDVSINLSKHDRSMNYTINLRTFKQQNNHYRTVRDVKRGETGTSPFSSLASTANTLIGKVLPSINPYTPYSLPVRLPLVPPGDKPISSRVPDVPFSAVAVPKSGTIPATPGTPYKSGTGTTAPPDTSQPCSYGGRSIGAPKYLSQTGTNPSKVPGDSPPVAPPRNKKRGKSELRKATRYDTFLNRYSETKEQKGIPKDESCPICLTPLLEPADVDVPKTSVSSGLPKEEVLALKKCSHMFHTICIGTMLDSGPSGRSDELSISCPICQTIHGVKTGDQPSTGNMNVTHDSFSVPGYEGFRTIIINYSFSDGRTGTGTNYSAAGFPRVCYIPDNPEGRKVLELLKLAWERRLIFTIGTSVTTGRSNCIVWNNIHHKTEPHSNSSGHGFPDPNFLKNIKMELAVQGVTESELK